MTPTFIPQETHRPTLFLAGPGDNDGGEKTHEPEDCDCACCVECDK